MDSFKMKNSQCLSQLQPEIGSYKVNVQNGKWLTPSCFLQVNLTNTVLVCLPRPSLNTHVSHSQFCTSSSTPLTPAGSGRVTVEDITQRDRASMPARPPFPFYDVTNATTKGTCSDLIEFQVPPRNSTSKCYSGSDQFTPSQ